MNRRNFIRTSGITLASVFISDSLSPLSGQKKDLLINFPDEVSALINYSRVNLTGEGNEIWKYQDLVISLKDTGSSISVIIQAPNINLSEVTLKWKIPDNSSSSILNDQWERTYGDVSWHKPIGSEILPWYFMELDGSNTSGFGVKTGAKAFCYWQIGNNKLSLTMDTRSGGSGVYLDERELKAAEIVTLKSNLGESPYQTTRKFTRLMCDKARMPKKPVYGINDWYFSYGVNSEKLIMAHTEMMAPMAEGLENRPFSVIDAGWFYKPVTVPQPVNTCWGDNMNTPCDKFGDMGMLAEKIRKTGMRPAIWTRPLCGSEKDPKSLMLPMINGRDEYAPILDPTIGENLERVKSYFKQYNDWSYEMVKIDFTTFDILGKWGFQMLKDRAMSFPGWSMHDNSKTNAEIILNLYRIMREAAGETYLIGCNTISHLSAGIFELNRIGDDTSGNEWARTRKMGVNTLAFRGVQHGTFYAADGDCVGLTSKVPWEKNKQWMELVAKSGTPLFISAQPEATGTEQKVKIRDCFRLASSNLPLGEPLDWTENAFPEKWKLDGKVVNFNWD
jgi:alpha-galactosidase